MIYNKSNVCCCLHVNLKEKKIFCIKASIECIGGGIATDESTQGLPLNAVDFDTLKPHLSFLLNIYGINYVSIHVVHLMFHLSKP